MAAEKRRERKFPQAEFDVPLSQAVAALIPPQDVLPGAAWHFSVDGDKLVITRIDPPEIVGAPPVEPEPVSNGPAVVARRNGR